MPAQIISRRGKELTLQVKVFLKSSMLESEESILSSVNEVGVLATQEALKQFDADGCKIIMGECQWYSKGKVPKQYQTPYGQVEINRHVYQTQTGGKTFCPLDEKARVITSSTPRYAKMLTHKYARLSAGDVQEDMQENHGRDIPRSFLQNLSDAVGTIAQAKEEEWEYAPPELGEPVASVAVSLDAASLLMCEEGYRMAMTGTVSLYDKSGERQHTVYVAASPEYGKETFMKRLEREVLRTKATYQDAITVGVADGAKDNWTFLEKHCDKQIIDFYHATEYLGDVALAIHPKLNKDREIWMDVHCHELKNIKGSALKILDEIKNISIEDGSGITQKALKDAVTYFGNNSEKMRYAEHVEQNLPIGSGVVEAACKTIIKQRLCKSGMKWKNKGAGIVLSIKALVHSTGRWNQFWDKINQFGVPATA